MTANRAGNRDINRKDGLLLAIDAGNTQTVIGVYDGSELLRMWRIATAKSRTADELQVKLLNLVALESFTPDRISGAVLASVVPALTASWKAALANMGVDALVCNAENAGTLFKAAYDNPGEIGADRIADAVAARALYGAPVIVVDFGTATNLEVIDEGGCFVGGIIAPGMETSAAALFAHATKLPTIDLVDPGSAIGKNTVHAMQSGIVYGEADRVDGFVRRVFAELGYTAPVVATGGLAVVMAPLCQTVSDVNPELTLEGLRLIWEHA